MFDYDCIDVSMPKLDLIDEVLHQSHQDLHLRARMHHKAAARLQIAIVIVYMTKS